MTTPIPNLSAADVRRALPMPVAIEAMREAFSQLSSGQVILPTRERLDAVDDDGVGLVMPCYGVARKLFTVKFTTVFHGNPQRGLPLIHSLIILTSGTTGEHLAVLDGASITAIRTGAAAGVATDLLARPDAKSVAVFGAGVQSRTQLEAVCCVRAVRRASVYDVDPTAADCFADEMTKQLDLPVARCDTPAKTLVDADVVCTATSSTTPVFEDDDLPPGTHINGIGSYRPDMVEIPAATVCRARVIVDHRESVLAEAGDLISPLNRGLIHSSHISAELGEILLNETQGRRTADEITFFKSVGVAIQDLCAAAAALKNYHLLGSGILQS